MSQHGLMIDFELSYMQCRITVMAIGCCKAFFKLTMAKVYGHSCGTVAHDNVLVQAVNYEDNLAGLALFGNQSQSTAKKLSSLYILRHSHKTSIQRPTTST